MIEYENKRLEKKCRISGIDSQINLFQLAIRLASIIIARDRDIEYRYLNRIEPITQYPVEAL